MTTTLEPLETQQPAAPTTTDEPPWWSSLSARDLVIPLLCAAAVGANILYLSQANLDSIERQAIQPGAIWQAMQEHIITSLVIVALVLLIAVPLGVAVTRRSLRWISPGVLAFSNAGQAVPTIGLLALLAFWLDTGFWTVVEALVLYTILPVLRNTIVGIQQVSPGVVDAARGMGMSNLGILLRVELRLAVPVIAAGARTALVLAIGTVTLGDFIGNGGLGYLLFQSYKLYRFEAMFFIALLVAVLALMCDWLGGLVQNIITPRGMR